MTAKLHVSCGREVVDLNDIFHPYLERIYQDVMIARCAGKHAEWVSLQSPCVIQLIQRNHAYTLE